MRNHCLTILSLYSFAFLAILGCKIETPASSGLSGDLLSYAQFANIASLRPGESIEFCGRSDQVAAAESALSKWLTPLGREGHINVNTCNQGSTLRINMTGINQCAGSPACNSYQFSYGGGEQSQLPDGTIEIQSSINGVYLDAIMLHELGHSFGLCDQYPNSHNCSTGSTKSNSEVMGTTDPTKSELTPGDIETVIIAASENLRSAEQWEEFERSSASNPSPAEGLTTFGPNNITRTRVINTGSGFTITVPSLF